MHDTKKFSILSFHWSCPTKTCASFVDYAVTH